MKSSSSVPENIVVPSAKEPGDTQTTTTIASSTKDSTSSTPEARTGISKGAGTFHFLLNMKCVYNAVSRD